ncbi:MAG: DUF1552 domain-containing protein [Pseudobdellovibrio sp.]
MSSPKKWEISRRTFINGLGISLGLPLLDAMMPSIARAGTAKTQRLVWIYLPLGYGSPYNNSGVYSFPSYVSNALSSVASEVSTITGLYTDSNQPAGTGNAHPDAWMPFINAGAMPTSTRGDKMSKTWDQYIADVNQGSTKKTASMVANYENSVYLFSPLEAHTMSYRGAGQPVGYYLDPKTIFDQMFAGATTLPPAPQIDQRQQDQLKRKRGILHYINEDIKKLEAKVGQEDRLRLEEYFTGLTDLDNKIASQLVVAPPPASMACQTPGSFSNTDYPTRLRLFYDILYYALKCDLTRVATVMHAMEGSHMIHSGFISGLANSGVQWHAYSHLDPGYEGASTNTSANRSDLEKVTSWHHVEIAKFVKRLKDTVLPNGQTLLDECAIVWGSSMSTGAGHDTRGLMMNIAGTANGALKKAVTINSQVQMANLYLTLMQAFGVTAVNSIGRSTGIISGLKV